MANSSKQAPEHIFLLKLDLPAIKVQAPDPKEALRRAAGIIARRLIDVEAGLLPMPLKSTVDIQLIEEPADLSKSMASETSIEIRG
jgi:hypothetical protein